MLSSCGTRDTYDVENGNQVIVSLALVRHVGLRVWIDQLVSERAQGHVRLLWDVEQLLVGGFDQLPAVEWPQLAKQTKDGRLARSIRPGDDNILAEMDF